MRLGSGVANRWEDPRAFGTSPPQKTYGPPSVGSLTLRVGVLTRHQH
jgi:hypothetical protein